MPSVQVDDVPHGDQLVRALDPAARERLRAHLNPADMKLGTVVCEAGGFLDQAYFPEGAVLSLLIVLENGSAIETANIGREGAFGLFAAMYRGVSFNRCIVKLQGPMIRCPITALRSEFDRSEHVRALLVSYSETFVRRSSRRWHVKPPMKPRTHVSLAAGDA